VVGLDGRAAVFTAEPDGAVCICRLMGR
jgi:hypothetical protein